MHVKIAHLFPLLFILSVISTFVSQVSSGRIEELQKFRKYIDRLPREDQNKIIQRLHKYSHGNRYVDSFYNTQRHHNRVIRRKKPKRGSYNRWSLGKTVSAWWVWGRCSKSSQCDHMCKWNSGAFYANPWGAFCAVDGLCKAVGCLCGCKSV
ncbi:uncharacterized protein LOC142349612 [Convolutriloba macropyga]|uniref:uncharacterized protein LOC142349612 n=1 Tax=Convolutriloba macropyga TaxID=536237 RepID=UPI003F527181